MTKNFEAEPRTSIALKESTRLRLYSLQEYGVTMDTLLNRIIDAYIESEKR